MESKHTVETSDKRKDEAITEPVTNKNISSHTSLHESTSNNLPSNFEGSNENRRPEEMLSVDQVSQMMREQDADLLERMHFDALRVSQYSSGRTPDHTSLPGDWSTVPPMDPLLDVSLRGLEKEETIVQNQPHLDGASSPTVKVATFFTEAQPTRNHDEGENSGESSASLIVLSKLPRSSSKSQTQSGNLHSLKESDSSQSWNANTSEREINEESLASSSRYRRLLSGEIRTMQGEAVPAPAGEKEEETIASPVSLAEEAAETALKQQHLKETGLAEKRRVHEAMQFAQAVGEDIVIDRDELRIIEDHSDEEASDDDDDDVCQSKEVVLNDQEIIQDAMSSSQATLEMMNSHANRQDAQERSKPKPLPTHVDIPQRKSKRPMWPFGPAGYDYNRFLDKLPDGADHTAFVYKGICANPPEITKRGIQRGNYAQLHRKAWLEVSDKYHRYGKNLRLYYRYWERLDFPTNQFFEWLDSKGEAAGKPLPNLEECPRAVLDSDTVLYITNPEVTEGYALDISCNEDGRARIFDVDGRPVATGQEGWIFILRDGIMYGAEKITSISGHSKQRFHHSSFFSGKAVAAAGIIITDDQGYLTRLYPHSGHYRPGEAHMQRMLFFLHRKGVDLRSFEMDTQQFRHVSRDKDNDKRKTKDAKEEKKKKVDSLHLEKAVTVACFLAHKANFIGNGIFDNIHKIRKADATSVSEALDLVDNGGYWHQMRLQRED